MNTTNQLPEPELGYIKTDTSNQPAFSARQMREAMGRATQTEVTDEQILEIAEPFGEFQYGDAQGHKRIDFARAILALRPQQSGLTGCNCRWDGDTQVQWCELHLAHKDAIHEWAERAKEAEKQLALLPERVPMTEDQVWHNDALMSANGTAGFKMDALMRIVRAVESHHG